MVGMVLGLDGAEAMSAVVNGLDGVGIGLDDAAALTGAINVGMVLVLHYMV